MSGWFEQLMALVASTPSVLCVVLVVWWGYWFMKLLYRERQAVWKAAIFAVVSTVGSVILAFFAGEPMHGMQGQTLKVFQTFYLLFLFCWGLLPFVGCWRLAHERKACANGGTRKPS